MRVQSSRAAKFLMVQTPEATSAAGENPDNMCNIDITEVCWYLNPHGKVVFVVFFFLQNQSQQHTNALCSKIKLNRMIMQK